MSKQEIVLQLEETIKENEVQKVLDKVRVLEKEFEEAREQKNKVALKAFLEDENNHESDFVAPKDSADFRFKELINIFNDKYAAYKKQHSEELKANYELKKELLADLKNLIENEETIAKAFDKFEAIKEKWRNTGAVPKHLYSELQNEWVHHNDLFYYTVNIYKDLKKLDLDKNLEAKQKVVEKINHLKDEKSIKQCEHFVKQFQEEWSEIGPVPHEKWEALRATYKEALDAVYQRIKEHYKKVKEEQKTNQEAKEKVIETIRNIDVDVLDHPKKWQEATKQVLDQQKEWKGIGFSPRKKREVLFQDYREACDRFFNAKQAYYEKLKEKREKIREKKEALLKDLEQWKDSTDWRKATLEIKNIQDRWKQIEPLSPREENRMWKKMRSTCDYFFDKKRTFYATMDDRQEENLKTKQALVEKIKKTELSGDKEKDLQELKKIAEEWTNIGPVPRKEVENINTAYKSALDGLYKNLSVDDSEKEAIQYQNRMDAFVAAGEDTDLLFKKEERILSDKVKGLKDSIIQYENNLSFFGHSKGAEKLRKDVEQRVEQSKKRLEEWEQKLKLLRKNRDLFHKAKAEKKEQADKEA
ncbi:MAG: DUF349 domain-containing protein [Chitinophagales bacterium]